MTVHALAAHVDVTAVLAAAPAIPPGTLAERGQALLGLFVFILIAFLIGRARGARCFPVRVVLWGVALQFAFGAIVLFAPAVLETVQLAIKRLLDFSNAGASLVFGNLIANSVSVTKESGGGGGVVGYAQVGFVFAFSVIPTIIFVSMLTAVLYHLGVLTWVVHGLAWIMRKTMGCSGAETLSTAANIFVGQTEAPLLVRPFLAMATRSELMAIMVGGFANIATGVLVVYTDLLQNFVPSAGGHLALACFISAPATLVVSKLMMPETESPETAGGVAFKVERIDANLVDAATRGTSEGLTLALNVAAMLIAFTALVALVNALVGGVTGWMGLGPVVATAADGSSIHAGWKLETIFGRVMAPLAWLTGIEWQYCSRVGGLLGIKTVLNEFLAYLAMKQMLVADPAALSPRAALLATYALCGFANFASVGIQIGGISVLAPTRRHDLSRVGLLAMVGGAIATLMAASVVGVLT
jgi:CNT family concentrative nucleoside transporter